MNRGMFITIEGAEGVGKSTQISTLRERLVARGLEVVATREPGGTPRAERIRELLLEHAEEPMPPSCELLLMFAARATHLENVIRPALARGAWVVCDRFTDASYAYQGAGRGIAREHIEALERLVQAGLQPDLTLLLDAPLAISAARARTRNAAAASSDRFEREQREFFERVRHAYLGRARAEPARFALIDAAQSVEDVARAIDAALEARLPVVSHG